MYLHNAAARTLSSHNSPWKSNYGINNYSNPFLREERAEQGEFLNGGKRKKLGETGHLQVQKTLAFKTSEKSSCDHQFHMHENKKKSFWYQWLRVKPALEQLGNGLLRNIA